MAIDQVAKVVVQFKGDTSDLKAKIRDLQGEEKRLAGEQLKHAEARNKGIESQIAMLGRMGAAAGTIGAVVVGAFAAMEKAAEHQRLATQAGRVDLERLSAAAGHTKSEMQLLSDAAKLQTAAFKPNQQQMELVEKAIRQLARENGNLDEVTKRVTESVVKLEGEGLKEYGIRVRQATSDSDKFNAIMEALGAKAGQLGDRNLTAAESLQKVKASFGDVTDRVVVGLGKMVSSLAPMLEGLASAVNLIGDIVEHANKFTPATLLGKLGVEAPAGASLGAGGLAAEGAVRHWRNLYKNLFTEDTGWEQLHAGALSDFMPGDVAGGSVDPAQLRLGLVRQAGGGSNLWDGSGGDISAVQSEIIAQQIRNVLDPRGFEESQQAVKDAAEAQLQAIEAKFEKDAAFAKTPQGMRLRMALFMSRFGAGVDAGGVPDFIANERAWQQQFGANRSSDPGTLGSRAVMRDDFGRAIDEDAFLGRAIRNTESERLTEQWNAQMDRMRGIDKGPGAGIRGAQKSQLEEMFGPISEFDAYAKGFQMLTGASQAAFSAWIDGSMSAGDAIKKFFAESLKGMAVDMLGKAIQHGVYAVGSLAFGDVRGAAQHGQAAAMAAAGAIALGGLAKALGPGAGAAPGAASTGGGTFTAGARGGLLGYEAEQRGSHQVIVVGDQFAEDSPRRRAANIQRQIERVGGANGVATR